MCNTLCAFTNINDCHAGNEVNGQCHGGTEERDHSQAQGCVGSTDKVLAYEPESFLPVTPNFLSIILTA